MVSGPAKLLVLLINHHGLYSVSELFCIDPARRVLQSTDNRWLFFCFLNIGIRQAMVATALERPQRPKTFPGVVNLKSPEPPVFAAEADVGASLATQRAGQTTAGPPTLHAPRALDTTTFASVIARTLSHQSVVMAPQAPLIIPPELAAPPAIPVAPPLDSSNSTIASSTSLLLQPSAAGNAAVGSPDGLAARTHARISPAKSPTPLATSPSTANRP